MRFRVLVLTCVAMALSVAASPARETLVLPDKESKQLTARIDREQMLFVVAKGAPNSCGPGCSEWIAAQGTFDPAASERFKKFLVSLPRRDLPIFLHSSGGNTKQAMLMAVMLRQNRMRAGVARTLPEGCRSDVATDPACRRLVQSKGDVQARLVTSGAKCSSACVLAFVGASVRQVAADARIEIHSYVLTSDKAQFKSVDNGPVYKRFLVHMGIESGLLDLINSVPFHRMRALTRAEIARFGIETRDVYETQWMLSKLPVPEHFYVRKSVTQVEVAGSAEYRTTRIAIACLESHGLLVSYHRELSKGEGVGSATMRFGGSELQLSGVATSEKDTEARRAVVEVDLLRKAIAEPAMEISEKLWLRGEYKPRVTRMSTAGLSSLLDRCPGKPAATPTPVHAATRDETPWTLHTDPAQQFSEKFSLRKSITRIEASGGPEQRKIEIAISCPDWWGLPLTYRRELSKNEDRVEASIRLRDRDLAMQSSRHTANSENDIELKSVSTSIDLLRGAAEKPTIEISEKLRLQGELKLRVTSFSTAELAAKLDELHRLCDASKRPYVHSPPAQAIAR